MTLLRVKGDLLIITLREALKRGSAGQNGSKNTGVPLHNLCGDVYLCGFNYLLNIEILFQPWSLLLSYRLKSLASTGTSPEEVQRIHSELSVLAIYLNKSNSLHLCNSLYSTGWSLDHFYFTCHSGLSCSPPLVSVYPGSLQFPFQWIQGSNWLLLFGLLWQSTNWCPCLQS